MKDHSYRILFRPLNNKGNEAAGSAVEVADADIVVEHDGEVSKDRFGNAAAILDKIAEIYY